MDSERFVEPLPDFLTCPGCLDAAWEPHYFCAQEHLCCSACLPDFTASADRSCPFCREPFLPVLKPSPLAKRVLGELKITCVNRACEWVGCLDQDQDHRSKSCEYRQVECVACQQKFTYAHRFQHHGVCPEALLVCPRGGIDCGGREEGGLYCRKDEREHKADCSNWPCSTPGCPTRTTRHNLPGHEEYCSAMHRRFDMLESDLLRLRGKKSVDKPRSIRKQTRAAEEVSKPNKQKRKHMRRTTCFLNLDSPPLLPSSGLDEDIVFEPIPSFPASGASPADPGEDPFNDPTFKLTDALADVGY
ncbi:hypothetical protein JCM8097_001299 [Rhodosporidiobolus ruineniae]